MIVSVGTGYLDKFPTRYAADWPAIVAWLRSPPVQGALDAAAYATASKDARLAAKDGRYIVFADLGEGGKLEKANVQASYAVPLDADEIGVPAEYIAAVLSGYAYAAYTTYGHSAAAPRWRVVVPTERPMSAAEHSATHATLRAMFQGVVSDASSDASRLNFLPDRAADPSAAQSIEGTGRLFPVSVPVGTEASTDDLTDEPIEGWAGPTDDDALLMFMLRGTRSEQAFGATVTKFEALWTADAAALAVLHPPIEPDQQFDHTRADAALANELAYYTGSHGTRCLDLFMRSALAQRERFREDKARRAVILACRRDPEQHAFLRPRIVAPSITVSMDPASSPAATDSTEGAGSAISQAGDFFAYLPEHTYIHRPTGARWPAASLDGTVGKDTRMMLDLTHPVHLLSWAPGLPERFQWRDLDGTDESQADSWCYNRYKRPTVPRRSGAQIDLWLKLLNRLYPNDADHILKYFADAVQNPGRKCNHALVLGSEVHGIGKDTLLKPLKWAVGERNYAIISPAEIFKDNNAWAASVVVQVSESRNIGDGDGQRISKYDMYERTKDLAAAPPTTLSCVDKWVARHQVRNVLRLILTTNHGIDGVYLPAQDRRHYCAWSDAAAMSETDALELHKWLDAGGSEEVAAFLYAYPLDDWNPGARPPQTAWWQRLVLDGAGEENPLAEALERMGSPDWTTAEAIAKEGGPAVASWFADSRNRKNAGRHLGALGYRRLANPKEKRGRYTFKGEARVVYAKPHVDAATLAV